MKACAAFLALVLAAAGLAGAATPPTPAAPAAEVHPYSSALAAVDNYASCRGAGATTVLETLRARMRMLETEGRRNGLGRALERVRQQYINHLSSASLVACVEGVSRSRSAARRAVDGFAFWITAQPAIGARR